jgi:hypothetical protein
MKVKSGLPGNHDEGVALIREWIAAMPVTAQKK